MTQTARARANVRIKIPRLHDAQRRVRHEAKRYNCVVCGRRWGKTTLGEDIVGRAALDGKPVAYFAPTYKMLAETWRQMRNRFEPAAIRISEQEHSMRLIGGGIIDMWSLEHADAPRGRRYAVIVVDEAAMIRNLIETWDEVLRPMLSDYRGSAWFLSTPKGENTDFHHLFLRGEDDERPRWASWQMPTATNPYIHPDEIEDARADMGEVAFRQEYMAEFVADVSAYIPADVWDGLHDRNLPPLDPGERTPIVLGVDASVTGDCFAVVPVTRHPERHDEVVIHAPRIWRPADFPDKRINFDVPERFLRFVCQGGHVGEDGTTHPPSMPMPGCEQCERADWPIPGHNVVQIAYDPYQLESMMQGLRRDRVAWCKEFSQGQERLVSDSLMHKMALRGHLHHTGSMVLREHIINAHALLETDKDSKMRIVKKEQGAKVDGAVAASMAVKRCLDLNI